MAIAHPNAVAYTYCPACRRMIDLTQPGAVVSQPELSEAYLKLSSTPDPNFLNVMAKESLRYSDSDVVVRCNNVQCKGATQRIKGSDIKHR